MKKSPFARSCHFQLSELIDKISVDQEVSRFFHRAEVNCIRLNDALRQRAWVEGEVLTTDIASFFSERLGFYYSIAPNPDVGLSDAKVELECLGMQIG